MKDPKVFILSLIALIFIVLTFLADWIFILPAAILSMLGWRMLVKKEGKG